MSSVVIIDDQNTTLKLLSQLVKSINFRNQRIHVKTFEDPSTALTWTKNHPPDLVLVDYKFPNLNGIEFIKLFRRRTQCATVPVIMITAYDEPEIRYKALDSGATDFLSKPIDHHECRARCRNLLNMRRFQLKLERKNVRLQNKVTDSTQAILDRERETLLRLARAGEYRDKETGNHILRIAKYSRLIAELIGLNDNQCDLIEHSTPMHDVGKICISDSILLKNSSLTIAEFEVMKKHTCIGYEILKDSPSKYIQTGAKIALAHHEHFDGKGYPNSTRGEEISIEARIVAVVDVFDALTSARPYKKAWPLETAKEYIQQQQNQQFDPVCVDAFIENFDKIIPIYNKFEDAADQSAHPDLQLCTPKDY